MKDGCGRGCAGVSMCVYCIFLAGNLKNYPQHLLGVFLDHISSGLLASRVVGFKKNSLKRPTPQNWFLTWLPCKRVKESDLGIGVGIRICIMCNNGTIGVALKKGIDHLGRLWIFGLSVTTLPCIFPGLASPPCIASFLVASCLLYIAPCVASCLASFFASCLASCTLPLA